jgi:hypothetical protein
MESVEKFMLGYLDEMSAMQKQSLDNFVPFRRRFYTDDCILGSRRVNKLKELLEETEKIVQISSSDKTAKAVTIRTGKTGSASKLRYNVIAANDNWLIQSMDLECPLCLGTEGNSSCSICKGEGWHPFPEKKNAHSGTSQRFDPLEPPYRRF